MGRPSDATNNPIVREALLNSPVVQAARERRVAMYRANPARQGSLPTPVSILIRQDAFREVLELSETMDLTELRAWLRGMAG
jgi:hypothetical protein